MIVIFASLFLPFILLLEYKNRALVSFSFVNYVACIVMFVGITPEDGILLFAIFIYMFILTTLEFLFPFHPRVSIKQLPIFVFLGICGLSVVLVSILSEIYSAGSVVKALVRNRLESYLSGGIMSSSLPGQILKVLLPFVYLYVGLQIALLKRKYSVFLIFVVTFWLLLTANTRFSIIIPIAAYFLIIVSKTYGVRRILLLLSVLCGLPLMLPLLNLGSALRNGQLLDIQWFQIFQVKNIKEQLGYVDWFNKLTTSLIDVTDFEWGAHWFINTFINFIPRAFWNDKPITSVSNRISEELYDITVGGGDAIYTFTIFGEAYLQFGYAGFFILPILYFSIWRWSIKVMSSFIGGQFLCAIYLMKVFATIRAETLIFQFLFLILSLKLVEAANIFLSQGTRHEKS